MQPTDPLYSQQWHFTNLGNIEKIWDEFAAPASMSACMTPASSQRTPISPVTTTPAAMSIIDGVPLDGEPNPTTPDRACADTGRRSGHHQLPRANNGEGGVGVAWGSTLTSIDIDDSTARPA